MKDMDKITITYKQAKVLHTAMEEAEIDPYDELMEVIHDCKAGTVRLALQGIARKFHQKSETCFGVWNNLFLKRTVK